MSIFCGGFNSFEDLMVEMFSTFAKKEKEDKIIFGDQIFVNLDNEELQWLQDIAMVEVVSRRRNGETLSADTDSLSISITKEDGGVLHLVVKTADCSIKENVVIYDERFFKIEGLLYKIGSPLNA